MKVSPETMTVDKTFKIELVMLMNLMINFIWAKYKAKYNMTSNGQKGNYKQNKIIFSDFNIMLYGKTCPPKWNLSEKHSLNTFVNTSSWKFQWDQWRQRKCPPAHVLWHCHHNFNRFLFAHLALYKIYNTDYLKKSSVVVSILHLLCHEFSYGLTGISSNILCSKGLACAFLLLRAFKSLFFYIFKNIFTGLWRPISKLI